MELLSRNHFWALPTHSTLECDKAPKHFLQHTTINSPIVRLWRRSVACWQSVRDNAGHGSLIWLYCSPQYPCPTWSPRSVFPAYFILQQSACIWFTLANFHFTGPLPLYIFIAKSYQDCLNPRSSTAGKAVCVAGISVSSPSWVLGLAVKGRRHEEHGHMMRQQYFIFHVTMTRDQRHFCFSASKHLPSAFIISILRKPHKVFRILSQEVAPWIF